ncbi:hypothetical protein NMY22_g15586 [Coprinellus aureogranulatus]|nr:hypothetical protein NMY22_g15586 [Coprinellus aureogranulatus]
MIRTYTKDNWNTWPDNKYKGNNEYFMQYWNSLGSNGQAYWNNYADEQYNTLVAEYQALAAQIQYQPPGDSETVYDEPADEPADNTGYYVEDDTTKEYPDDPYYAQNNGDYTMDSAQGSYSR